MKYLFLTIAILASILASALGIVFYSSYALWLNTRDEVIDRLVNLRSLLAEKTKNPVSLTPSLRLVNSTVLYDRHMRVIGEFSDGRRSILPLQEVPPMLVQAVLIMEDSKFYLHRGFDLKRMAGAMVSNIRTLSFSQGGSTITQQLANILFTDSRKTIRRKIYEFFCTREIERRFSKDEILSLYLNSIYLGHHNYGIENASRFYFKKVVFDLDIFDVSLLVGMIPNPARFSPLTHPSRCRRKQMIVLNELIQHEMADPGYLKDELEGYWESFSRIEHNPTISFWSVEENRAPYFVEYVRQYLVEELGEEITRGRELRVYTTLNLEKQLIAEQVLKEGLSMQNEKLQRGQWHNPEGDPGPEVEGALIAIHPRSGAILAMVGGSGYIFENQFNRAVSSLRQVGSSFKPFVYAAAFEEKGYTRDSIFIDRPIEIRTRSGVWRPQNYEDDYYGRVTLEFAMKKSLNSVAVQLLQETGPDPVIRIIARALDFDDEEAQKRFKPFPSLALGAYSFSPLEFVRAYSIFQNGGEKVFPHAVVRVEDRNGRVIIDLERDIKKMKTEYDLENRLRVIQPETAEKINELLGEVLKKGGTAYNAVRSSGLTIEGYGKTGTTNNYTDAWFIGYTRDTAVAVWVGFDDPSYSLGEGQAGGAVAAPIWAEFMKRAFWREE